MLFRNVIAEQIVREGNTPRRPRNPANRAQEAPWRKSMEEVMLREHDRIEDVEDVTVGSVYESIETNLWLAEAYFRNGHEGLAIECLREAWMEYVRFRDVLMAYSSSGELGE